MVKFDDSFSNIRLTDLHLQEEERYVQAMAPQIGFQYISLQGYTINPAALGILPEHVAKAAKVVCFELKHKTISIAAKTPNSPETQKVLSDLQSKKYELLVYVCSDASLEHAWKRYKDIKNSTKERKGVFEISAVDIKSMMSSISTVDDVKIVLQKIKTSNNARRISETMELILAGALALGASDIHIEPEVDSVRLRYRFDGVLHDVTDLELFMHKRLMSRFKLLSGMKLNRKAEAQDGRFTFDIGDKEIEIRSSVIPGATDESIVMRILDPGTASFTLDKVEMSPQLAVAVTNELKKPNGLILTTGPTGSGKTTILYAFLRENHKEGVKIITIENPVEYKLDGIVQTQIDGDYTFASGLRAILRQDPDIIMIGEIRDREVAETAMHAAQTGHLVFSTLHTNSAVASFARLIDLGVDRNMLGTSINMILGQRLVRLLCEACKEKRNASPSEVAQIQAVLKTHPAPPTLAEPVAIFEPKGCEVCGESGFKGRAGIFEAIIMDTAVEEAILRDPREHIILEAARPQGIPTMAEDGIVKVLEGRTSLLELERVIELPKVIDIGSEAILTEKATVDVDDDFLSHVV